MTVSDIASLAITDCDRLARLNLTDVGRQLEFWQDLGFVDKQIVPADLLDLSFIDPHIE